MALVVAIAGMIFPAISATDQFDFAIDRHTFGVKFGLDFDAKGDGAKVGSCRHKVEAILVILLERQHRGSDLCRRGFLQPLAQ